MKHLLKTLTFTSLALCTAFNIQAATPQQETSTPKITYYKDRIASFRNENIQLTNPVVRKAKKHQNSAAFVKVTNTSTTPQQIVSATSPVAHIIELHTSYETDGIYKMRPVSAIDVPAAGVVELKSGGFHVMLIDLKHDLHVGQEIPVTFEMDNGNKIETTYTVKEKFCRCQHKK